MESYDPNTAPDPTEWLALDEGERVMLVEDYHRRTRVRLPRAAREMHGNIHAVIEAQLAMNEEPVVRALQRMLDQGLSRHDAIHAVGSVLARHLYNAVHGENPPDDVTPGYFADLDRLTAKAWLKLAERR